MTSFGKWVDIYKARLKTLFPREREIKEVVLLDTSLNSENIGDYVIMDACSSICRGVFGNKLSPVRLSTHEYSGLLENQTDNLKLLCGTNIVYTRMENQKQWVMPHDLASLRNTCFLGVGMSDIEIDRPVSLYTKALFDLILCKKYCHSVRDSLTALKLCEAGVTNVLNTACPTMWGLNRELVRGIPKTKKRRVMTSITDYAFDSKADFEMLNILKEEYEEVCIWTQGSHDIDWCLEKIVDLSEFRVIDSNLALLDAELGKDDIDYVGTRLHAGIRSLSRGNRTLIIAVDNRARQIGLDTNLPVMERDAIQRDLSSWINSRYETEIELPYEAINEWKSQFSKGLL